MVQNQRKDSPRFKPSPDVKRLRLWVFKIVFSDGTICLEGYKPQDPLESELKCWHSTSVIHAINSRLLKTISGTIYYLQGPMDIETALGYGYPENLIDHFKDGFPPNWNQLLMDFFTSLQGKRQCNVSQWFNSCILEPKRKLLTDSSNCLLSDAVERLSHRKKLVANECSFIQKRQSHALSVPMTPVAEDCLGEQSFTIAVTLSRRNESEKEQNNVNSKKTGHLLHDDLIREKAATFDTPVCNMVKKSKGGFGVSQRGRILKPPLANWIGQRISYDVSGKAIKLTDAITKSDISNISNSRTVSLTALSNAYDLPPARQAVQRERGRSLIKVSGRRQMEMDKNTALVAYDSSDTTASSCNSTSHSSTSPPPICRRRQRSKMRLDDSIEWELAREERRWRRREKRRREIERTVKRLLRQVQREKSKNRDRMASVSGISAKSERKMRHSRQSAIGENKVKVKKQRWTNEEYRRLKLAIQAIGPRSTDQWDRVARALGGTRSGEECHRKADAVLGYGLQSESDEQPVASGHLGQMRARAGTAAYSVQAQRMIQTLLVNRHLTDDYFEQTRVLADSLTAMPSLAEVDCDDSIVSALQTPQHAADGAKRGVRLQKPHSTPGSSFFSSTPLSANNLSDMPVQRDRMIRYVHQVNEARKQDERQLLVNGTRAKIDLPETSSHLLHRFLHDHETIAPINRDGVHEEEEEEEAQYDDYLL